MSPRGILKALLQRTTALDNRPMQNSNSSHMYPHHPLYPPLTHFNNYHTVSVYQIHLSSCHLSEF